MITTEEIEKRFTYHAPKGTAPERFVTLREIAKGLAECVNALVPEGREKALALTKIEEAVMWANAGVARNPDGAT